MQTTRVVCTDYSWSLQKGLRAYKFKYTVLVKISACTYISEYVVLTETSTHTHGKRIKTTKQLMGGENIDEPYKGYAGVSCLRHS